MTVHPDARAGSKARRQFRTENGTVLPADDDLDALLSLPERPNGRECATGWALQRIDADAAEKMRTIMARSIGKPEARALVAAFTRRGIDDIGELSILRHASGRCRNCADRSAAA